MKTTDPLKRFEALTPQLALDAPPSIQVVPQVLRRIRLMNLATTETAQDVNLAWMAACSCLTAIMVVMIGLQVLSQSEPMESIFQLIPPIGL